MKRKSSSRKDTLPRKRVKLGKSLLESHPTVAAQWHATLNGILSPSHVSFGSGTKVWWKCDKRCTGQADCIHEWEASISKRTNKNGASGCPHCANRSLDRPCCASNSLANVKYADLIAQWDTEKNDGGDKKKKTPRDYYPSSGIKVWWKCDKRCTGQPDCIHEWEATISDRTKKNGATGCPYCARISLEIDHVVLPIHSQT